MKRDWLTPAIFGMGTFFILLGGLNTLGVIQMGTAPVAQYLVGIGFFMIGMARLRSRNIKLRKKK
jgi:hypothetical protein